MNHIPTPQARLQPDTFDQLADFETALIRAGVYLETLEVVAMEREQDSLLFEIAEKCREALKVLQGIHDTQFKAYCANKNDS